MVAGGSVMMGSGGVVGGALSLAVTTMGAGILTLPSAFADAGVIPAMLLLIGVAILTVYSIDFIILGVDKLGRNSYEELARELLGPRGEQMVRFMLLVLSIGGAVSYLVIIGDLLTPLQPTIRHHIPFLATAKQTLLCLWAVLILPLSCVHTLGALHITSFLSVASTSLICCMIVFRYFFPGPTPPSAMTQEAIDNGTATPLWWWGTNPLLALPIMMFSFGCQFLVFQVYAGLSDMRRSSMMHVSVLSLIITGTIHAAVGLFGYLSNPVDVRENIISNYDPNVDYLFTFGYVLYIVPIITAFAMMLFPIRDALFFLWYGYSSASVATHVPRSKDYTRLVDKEEKLELLSLNGIDPLMDGKINYGSIQEELGHVVEAKKHHNDVETIPLRDHLLVSITLSTLCVTVALMVPGIVAVASFIGGFSGAPLFFLTPGLFRWQLHYKNIARCQTLQEWCIMVFMVAFGTVGMIVGTAVSVIDIATAPVR